MKIVRMKLTPDDLTPPGTRYNEECNCIQVSPDGGTTWNDAPGSDPRYSDAFRLPPIEAADPRCQAAANATALLHQSIDKVLEAASVAQATTVLLDLWLLAVGPVGWIIDLIVIMAEGLLAIGTAAIELAFTDTVYHEIQCIFFCNMGDDGQVSHAQLEQISSDIHDLGDSVVSAVMDYVLNTWGEVGLSNAGAKGNADADCDDCAACFETCHLYDPMVLDTDYTNSNDGTTLFGTYDTGTFAGGKSLVLTRAQATWTQTGGTGTVTSGGLHLTVYSDDVYPSGHTFTANDLSSSASADIDTSGSGHVTRIIAQIFTAWSGGGPYSVFDTLQFEYDPVRSPFGWSRGDDCTEA